jgi:hypothetical protein
LLFSIAAKSGSFFLVKFVKFENGSVTGVKIAEGCGIDQFLPEILGYVLPEWDTDAPQVLSLKTQVTSAHFR